MQNVSWKIWFLVFLLPAFSLADSYSSNWNFSLGCPTHDDTSGSGSLNLSSGGFSGSGSCGRLSNGLGKYTLSSSGGGTLRSSTIYPIQMGNLSFIPPIRTTDSTPVFSVAARCPSATKPVNWIFIQSAASRTADYFWGRSTMTPTSTTMSQFFDIDGTELFNGSYSAPVGGCTSGVIDVSGSVDFQAKIYSADDWSGFYKTAPGNVSFFAPIWSIAQSYLGSKTYVGLLYSSQDSESSRQVRVTSNAGGSVFTIKPLSDPETDTLAAGAGSFTDTITITAVNSPLSGMMKGTVERVDHNSQVVGTTEKVGCLAYETGTGGIVISCAGKNPADNSTQYSVTFNYKFAAATADISFATTGTSTLGYMESGEVAYDFEPNAVALQSDGKVVAALTIDSRFGVARFTADGQLDTTFASGAGWRDIFFSNELGVGQAWFGGAQAVAIQPDGKILVGGYANNVFQITARRVFALVRLNSDGSYDTSFGDDSDGRTTLEFLGGTNGDFDEINSILVLGDGKIVVAGWSYRDMNRGYGIARYHSDGTLDTDFGTNGKLRTTDAGAFAAAGIAMQSNGKLVVGGYRQGDPDWSFTVARYEADGTPDTSFGTLGVADIAMVGGAGLGAGFALQADDKIVIGGMSNGEFALARFDANGSPDSSFGTSGRAPISVTTSTGYRSVAIQSDGKIVAQGCGDEGSFIVRHNSDGSPDTTFSGDGVLTHPSANVACYGALSVQSDGKIISVASDFDEDTFMTSTKVLRLWP